MILKECLIMAESKKYKTEYFTYYFETEEQAMELIKQYNTRTPTIFTILRIRNCTLEQANKNKLLHDIEQVNYTVDNGIKVYY